MADDDALDALVRWEDVVARLGGSTAAEELHEVAEAREDVGMHVRVVEDVIGGGEDLGRAHRDEARITAPCTDERDLAPHPFAASLCYCDGAQVETPAPTTREGSVPTLFTELSAGRQRVTSEPPPLGDVNM